MIRPLAGGRPFRLCRVSWIFHKEPRVIVLGRYRTVERALAAGKRLAFGARFWIERVGAPAVNL